MPDPEITMRVPPGTAIEIRLPISFSGTYTFDTRTAPRGGGGAAAERPSDEAGGGVLWTHRVDRPRAGHEQVAGLAATLRRCYDEVPALLDEVREALPDERSEDT